MTYGSNTAFIQSVYEAFGRGDIAFVLASLTDDVEWTLEAPPAIPFQGRRVGHGQVLGFFEALGSTLTGMHLTMTDFIEEADRVASFGRFTGTVQATGRSFDTPAAHMLVIRDGKIARFVDFLDTAAVAIAYTPA